MPTTCLSVFDHFVKLALEGLKIPLLNSSTLHKNKMASINASNIYLASVSDNKLRRPLRNSTVTVTWPFNGVLDTPWTLLHWFLLPLYIFLLLNIIDVNLFMVWLISKVLFFRLFHGYRSIPLGECVLSFFFSFTKVQKQSSQCVL